MAFWLGRKKGHHFYFKQKKESSFTHPRPLIWQGKRYLQPLYTSSNEWACKNATRCKCQANCLPIQRGGIGNSLFCCGKLIPWFAFLVCVAFALLIKLSLCHPMSFFTFTLLFFSSIPLWGSERVAAWGLAAGWGQILREEQPSQMFSTWSHVGVDIDRLLPTYHP